MELKVTSDMIHLTVSSLYKKYGAVTALSDLSFQATSDIIGISGHNGSGKSTLLKCLAGLLKPTRGEIHCKFDGVVKKKEDLLQHLGFSRSEERRVGKECGERRGRARDE